MHFLCKLIIVVLFVLQLDIMEPKVPEDIYKTHLEPNSKPLDIVSNNMNNETG